jgi:homoserine kinase type II
MTIEEIKNYWPLEKILKIEKYNSGEINDSYKIKNVNGLFTLRIYKDKKIKNIKFEVFLLNKISHLPVPKIIKIPGKGYIFKIKDRYAIIYKYIKGKSLNKINYDQLGQVGKFLAKFHIAGKNFLYKAQRDKFYFLPINKIKKIQNFCLNKKTKNNFILNKVVNDLSSLCLDNNLPKGPIHVDIKPENVLFYRSKLSGVIDFDNSYIGPYVFDLAKSMVLFGSKNKKFEIKKSLKIIKNYIIYRKLNYIERRGLYKNIKFAFLSHIIIDFYMYNLGKRSKKYFNYIVKDFYKSYQNFNITENKFNNFIDKL